jgi:hypothetical protein
MNKKIIAFLSLVIVLTISYILFKLFYPVYINIRFKRLLNENYKDLLIMYNIDEFKDFLEIRKMERDKIAKPFITKKIKTFYSKYPFVIGGNKIIVFLKKVNVDITPEKLYQISEKIIDLEKTKNKDGTKKIIY